MVQRRKEPNIVNTWECKKVPTLLLSTTFLIGLNITFYDIFAKQHVY